MIFQFVPHVTKFYYTHTHFLYNWSRFLVVVKNSGIDFRLNYWITVSPGICLVHSPSLFSPHSFFFFLKKFSLNKFIYLFLAVLGLRFCARAFPSCGEQGPLFIAVHGPLTIVASLVAEHRLRTHRLSSCGSQAQLLHGMWDLPRPGLEPMSPALVGDSQPLHHQGSPFPTFLTMSFDEQNVVILIKSNSPSFVLYFILFVSYLINLYLTWVP